MSTILTLLFQLLFLLQANPHMDPVLRQQVIAVAQQAIQTATKQIGTRPATITVPTTTSAPTTTTTTTTTVAVAPRISLSGDGSIAMHAGGSSVINGSYLTPTDGDYTTTKVFIGGIQAPITYYSQYLLGITVPSSLAVGESYDMYVSNSDGNSNVVRVRILDRVTTSTTPIVIGTYPAGCTSYSGYSSVTGNACDESITTTRTTPTTLTYPLGCASNTGYSSMTGESCATATDADISRQIDLLNAQIQMLQTYPDDLNISAQIDSLRAQIQKLRESASTNYPDGCSSYSGYSSITGQACDGTPQPQTYPAGCASYSGYSSITGNACDGSTADAINNDARTTTELDRVLGEIQKMKSRLTERYIQINSPNGGERLTEGQTYQIRWQSNKVDTVHLGWSSGAGSFNPITSISGPREVLHADGYDWKVDVGNLGGNARDIKISVTGYETGVGSSSDESDGFFTVVPR